MKKKDLRKLAEKIVRCEKIIQNSLDENEILLAENEIQSYSFDILFNIEELDSLIQELLEK